MLRSSKRLSDLISNESSLARISKSKEFARTHNSYGRTYFTKLSIQTAPWVSVPATKASTQCIQPSKHYTFVQEELLNQFQSCLARHKMENSEDKNDKAQLKIEVGQSKGVETMTNYENINPVSIRVASFREATARLELEQLKGAETLIENTHSGFLRLRKRNRLWLKSFLLQRKRLSCYWRRNLSWTSKLSF